MTIIRRTGARIALAVAVLAALAIGAAGASAAPGSIRALDLSAPSLGARVEVAAPGGGTFNADPGRALVRVSPAGGTATQVLAWCVDPAHYISEGVDYPVDLQTPADTPELAGPGYAQAGWLIASSERMIADAADPGLEAAAIQVAVWQITGTAADTANVTTSAALNARVAQIRALAAGRTIVTALELSAPAAAVDVGAPVTVTVSGTPGAVVDLAVTSGAATLSSAQVVVAPSGTVAVSLTPSAAGPVVVAASAQGGTLHRAARLAGRRTPQSMAYVTPATLSASAAITAVAPAPAPPAAPAPPPAVVTAPVSGVPARATLRLVKRAPARARQGGRIIYRLTITNVGTVIARNVVLRDRVPAGTYIRRLPARIRMSRGSMVWRIKSLRPGATKTIRVVLRIRPRRTGDIVNVAIATASNAATVRARARTQVLLPARARPARVQPAVTG